jgi:ATP-dependent helicase HrpA
MLEIVEASARRRRERAAAVPAPRYPAELPVVERRAEIAAAIERHQVVIVCGETGSGKSTQLPKICLEAGRGVAGMIGHTQPRRIAARSLAARVADELGQPLGGQVGFKIRFHDRTGEACLIKVMTDGMLLAETQGDRWLGQYDTIIVDEAHERSLNIDFLLGYLRQLLPRRPDLKLVITSATIDPHRFSEHFGDAPVVEVTGRTYPVEIIYRPLRSEDPDELDREQGPAILEAVDELAARGPGDVLVFLPGEREIRETAEALRKHHPPATEILPLFARLSREEQDRVFAPHQGRRIVLATNVAETSLTVPGIRYVVDPGEARISRYSARRRVQLLPIEPVSQASARQRAGRCGRLQDGACIRLYAEQDLVRREPFTQPEILRTNLASVILQMHALRLGAAERFPFLEPPRPAMVRDGMQTLRELNALDDAGRLTELGRSLARLPVDPRIGRMILAADEEHCLTEVLVIAAALSVQDPRHRPHDRQEAADEAHARFQDERSDFVALLNLWNFYHERRKHLSWSKLRRCCADHFVSFRRMREWVDVHRQLKRIVTESGHRLNGEPADGAAIHRALLSGLLSNVAMHDDRGVFRGTGGKKVAIFPGSGLRGRKPRWLVAAELVETTRLYARTVAQVRPEWIERVGAHLVRRRYARPRWDAGRGRVVADESVTLMGLPVVTGRPVHYGPIAPSEARAIFIEEALVERSLRTDAPFMEHNRALVESVEALQAKRRRTDLLVDAARQAAFYERRVPADVFTARHFERWRRRAEQSKPRLLFMQQHDLMTDAGAALADQEAFPDVLELGSTRLPLEYRLDPGGADDGVTVVVPVEAVNQLDAGALDWLVPGMLREKIVALLRTLPKPIRRRLVPAPDWAAACADRLAFRQGTLGAALATQIHRLAGVEIPPDAWRPDDVPPHLRMNVRVVDAAGKTVAAGRDLDALRQSLSGSARRAFTKAAARRFSRRGITSWDFGDLPARTGVTAEGLALTGYPAVIDEGRSVALTMLDSAALAERRSRRGMRRLVLLEMPGEIQSAVEILPGIERLDLLYAPLGPAEVLRDEIAMLVADRAVLRDDPLPRSGLEFQRRLDEGFGRVWEAGLEIADLVRGILETRQELAAALEEPGPPQWEAAAADIERHLERLVPPDVLSVTPWRWLAELPRLLRGELIRWRKLANGGHVRDERQMEEMRPLWTALEERAEADRQRGIIDPRLEEHRWLLRELRISRFAQELGTSVPVSTKRLARHWEQICGGGQETRFAG